MFEFDEVKYNMIHCLRMPQKDNVATKPFLDMEHYVRIVLAVDEDHTTYAVVTDSMLEFWNMTIDEVFTKMPPIDAKTFSMREMLGDFIPVEADMTILSNVNKQYGANFMLSRLGMATLPSCYIIPSSVHELLVQTMEYTHENTKMLNEMVREVNDNEVDEKDRLSYNVYYWDADKGELSIAK